MACYSPFKKEVKVELANKVGDVSHYTDMLDLPCGKCDYCVKRRISEWELRLTQEDKRSTSAYFVTLTYDTEHVPITPKGFMSLHREPDGKSHTQLFFKRLRKLDTKEKIKNNEFTYKETKYKGKIRRTKVLNHPIKYYLVGEYGGKTNRPHYHLILFNFYPKDTVKAWQILNQTWGLGNVHLGKVERASIRYTIGYINKHSKIPMFEGDDRVPEYNTSSRHLGDNYLSDNMINFHKQNLDKPYAQMGKYKIPLPRYYKDKIYSPHERFMLRVQAQETRMNKTDEELELEDKKRIHLGIIRKDREQRL